MYVKEWMKSIYRVTIDIYILRRFLSDMIKIFSDHFDTFTFEPCIYFAFCQL